MRKIIAKLIYSTLFTLTVLGCNNPDVATLNNKGTTEILTNRTDISITEAQDWFNNTYLKTDGWISVKSSKTFIRRTFWNRAYKSKLSNNQDLIIVPIEHHEETTLPNADTYLWIFRNDENNLSVKVVEYLSANKNVAKNIDFTHFTGVMTISDWEGNLLNGFVFKDGASTGLLSNLGNRIPRRLSEAKNSKTSGTICNTIWLTRSSCTDFYYKVCINGQCTESTHSYSDCSYYYEIKALQCYWAPDFPWQTMPSTGSTTLPGNVEVESFNTYYVIKGPKNRIPNLSQRLNCFGSVPSGSRYKYSLTLYVDQARKGTRDLVDISREERKPGHAYVGMEQLDSQTGETKRLVLGFYTQSELAATTGSYTAGAWGDDGNTPYTVSVKVSVTASQFQETIYYLENLGTPAYNLVTNNCTTMAASIISPYLKLPGGSGPIGPLGTGMTPGNLGQDLFNDTATYGPYGLNVGYLTSPSSINCN